MLLHRTTKKGKKNKAGCPSGPTCQCLFRSTRASIRTASYRAGSWVVGAPRVVNGGRRRRKKGDYTSVTARQNGYSLVRRSSKYIDYLLLEFMIIVCRTYRYTPSV
uniref:Uncharacterized protein n=1 Tax=Leersia perrieri TaxID=77586 RepID=A0A0D9W922_9ORYZ